MPTHEAADWQAKVASRVKKLRKARGMSQGQLADRCGVAQSSISKLEKHGLPCAVDLLYKIAYVLDVTIHDLLPERSVDALPEKP